jgi:hypothetical protein
MGVEFRSAWVGRLGLFRCRLRPPDASTPRSQGTGRPRGTSLNAYLLEILSREVAQPTVGEVLERAARRTERAEASALDALDAGRWERDAQLAQRSGG